MEQHRFWRCAGGIEAGEAERLATGDFVRCQVGLQAGNPKRHIQLVPHAARPAVDPLEGDQAGGHSQVVLLGGGGGAHRRRRGACPADQSLRLPRDAGAHEHPRVGSRRRWRSRQRQWAEHSELECQKTGNRAAARGEAQQSANSQLQSRGAHADVAGRIPGAVQSAAHRAGEPGALRWPPATGQQRRGAA